MYNDRLATISVQTHNHPKLSISATAASETAEQQIAPFSHRSGIMR
jgi:hypothetical protein